jgi:glycosyltransferase involved in cell wall biosynthesis
MKIIHVTKKYPDALGGDAVAVANLENQQRKLGLDVFILTHRYPEVANKQNIAKFGLNLLSSDLDKITLKRLISLLSLPFYGYRYLKKIQPDIIHSHSPDLGFAISFPARVLGIPVVNTCHGVSLTGNNLPLLKKYAENFFLKYSGFARIITVDSTSVTVLEQHGISNVAYIPNGVDPDFWEKKQTVTRGSPGKQTKITFLFVGRLEEQKGLIYLIEAVRRLKSGVGKFTVQLVGEGSQRSHLEKLVDAYGLGNYVKFTGRLDLKSLRDIYLDSDIFVLPSLWEGMPLTLLEAWASGLPVILTSVGNIPELCVNMENAWIIEPGNAMDLFNAMFELIKSDELRDRLGRNGLMTVRKNYSWSTVAQKTLHLYKNICKN